MLGIANARDPLLINTVGHSVGLMLFFVLVVLLISDGRRRGYKHTSLSLAAASLALLWNLGSLLVLAVSGDPGRSLGTLAAFSFSVLSVLPSVLLHLVLRGNLKGVVVGGYMVSGAAVVLHLFELQEAPSRFHQWALFFVSGGFPLLIGIAVVAMVRSQRAGPAFRNQLVSLGALFLFVLSFLHFGYRHTASAWTAEVTWHHAGIPLVLIVLLQDYRFLLLDVFLRFLFNFGLAAGFAFGGFLAGEEFHLWGKIAHDEFWFGIGLVALCLIPIAFAYSRSVLQRWLTSAVFQRISVEVCAKRLVLSLGSARSEGEMLDVAAANLAECMGAKRFVAEAMKDFAHESDGQSVASVSLARSGATGEQRLWAEAMVPIRLSRGDSYCVLLGSRRGGRHYFSEDLEVLRRLSAVVIEQVERFRHEALKRLLSEAELRALQSQINPHFLFNALNTVYGTIDRTSQQARRMVLNLAEILRYALQTDRQFIQLNEELKIVRAYLEIEKLRLGDRLEVAWSVTEASGSALIPVLSIQPLVENAIKHGISVKREKGTVRIVAEQRSTELYVAVEDTGAGFQPESALRDSNRTGVGLDNVRQRLKLYYGDKTELKIRSDARGSLVSFIIPVDGSVRGPQEALRSRAELAR